MSYNNENQIHYMLSWSQFLKNHEDEELLQLLEPGDEIIIDNEVFTIIAPSTEGKNMWLRPHTGYLGDRVFPISTVIKGLNENLIIERRLKRLELEEGQND